MNIYLLCKGQRGTSKQTARAYFFKRSAEKAAARRIANGGDWKSVDDHETSATQFWITPGLWMSIVPVSLLFRAWSLRSWVRKWFHWQNLNQRKNGSMGTGWRAGRAWFRPFGYEDVRNRCISFEWSLAQKSWAGVTCSLFAGDLNRDVKFAIGFWWASFYFALKGFLPERLGWPRHSWEHETGFQIWPAFGCVSGPSFYIGLHYAGSDCWDCGGWKGGRWVWYPLDFLLGEHQFSERELLTESAVVRMPEREYPVTVRLTEAIWKRPRSLWPLRINRAHIECESGIPIPGKGENSWDCGDDATYSLTCPAATVEDAVESLRVIIVERRARYGGAGWLPSEAISA